MTEKTTSSVPEEPLVQDVAKPQKWTYVTAWLKAEPFWQGVAASTLSTGVMAIAGLLAGIVTGWIDWKNALLALLSFALVLSVAGLILFAKPSVKQLRARWKAMDKESTAVTIPGLVSIAGVSAGLLGLFKAMGW